MGFSTFVWINTFVRNISVYASSNRAARIISTFVTIIAFYLFIFARVVFITFSITTVFSASIVVITVNLGIFASRSWDTSYRITSIFIFAFIDFIVASTFR